MASTNRDNSYIKKHFTCSQIQTHKMESIVPWKTEINFASALLLHSCITIVLKEIHNCLVVTTRILARQRILPRRSKRRYKADHSIRTSVVLDAYTSVFSLDLEGEMAELYFTNTGIILLAVSLASSVAMNLLLDSLILNTFVAGTFGLTFIASLLVPDGKYTRLFMALRRAGRFIWSDTPFVNFFALIYIATVLRGKSNIRLQDYITLRSIAVIELVFMKAKLAASDPTKQISLMRQLIASERKIIHAVRL